MTTIRIHGARLIDPVHKLDADADNWGSFTTDSIDAEERMFRAGQLHMTWALPLAKVRPAASPCSSSRWARNPPT